MHRLGMIKKILLILLIAFCLKAQSQQNQDSLLNWVNSNAIDLSANKGFNQLKENLKGVSVVGLGEGSHGTKEFFEIKNDLIIYLIQNLDFKSIGFEFLADEIERANRFILTGEGDLKSILKNYRLFNTKEFYNLFTWIKNYNQKLKDKQKIEVYGLDKNYFNPFERDSLMAGNVIERQLKSKEKTIIWGHNLHIANELYGPVGAMGYYLNKSYNLAYYAIALDTYSGSVNTIKVGEDQFFEILAHNLEMPKNNFTTMFSKADLNRFFINFRTVKPNPFSGIQNAITNIWADWRAPFELPVKLGKNYDALIFMKTTSASEILK